MNIEFKIENELYCTECSYFKYTGEESDIWYGARCNKDGHETDPSMMAIYDLYKNCPLITKSKEQEPSGDVVSRQIEQKCDRINSIASVLPYTAHREIQELLCEIMDLIEPQESEG